MTGDQSVEVGHHALFPQKRPRVEFRIQGRADHRAGIVNADADARYVTRECAQIQHPSFPSPEKSVKSFVALQVRVTDYLALVIDVKGDVSACLSGFTTEIAEVCCFAFFPQQGMNRHEVKEQIGVESCTSTRPADNLSVVVDLLGDAIGIAPKRRQFVNHSFFPDDGLKVENLRSWAARVWCCILRKSGYFSPVADRHSHTVVASESRELNHFPVLPQERQTGEVGTESAKIFAVGIGSRGFSFTSGLESFVVAKRDAVRSSESGCADVDLQFFQPKGCMLIAVGEVRRATHQAISVNREWLAEGSAL